MNHESWIFFISACQPARFWRYFQPGVYFNLQCKSPVLDITYHGVKARCRPGGRRLDVVWTTLKSLFRCCTASWVVTTKLDKGNGIQFITGISKPSTWHASATDTVQAVQTIVPWLLISAASLMMTQTTWFVCASCEDSGMGFTTYATQTWRAANLHMSRNPQCRVAGTGLRTAVVEIRPTDTMVGGSGAARPVPDLRHQPPG